MNFLKNIVGRVMALWALLVFVITLFVFVIPMGLAGLWPEPKLSKIAYFFYSRWMTLFFILIGVRRVIKGRKNFKKGQNYVVICNHRSLMDPPLSSPAIPGANRTIAKSEMAKIPVFGIIYKRGSVLVDRKSEESRRTSFLKMKEVLALGLHMCIYPEGTRNKTAEPLQRFHDGAFKLAVDAGKSIIPALIFNTENVLPRKTFFFWPTKVEMHFLPEIAVSGRTVPELKEEAFEIMSRYYLEHK
ncbi:MAG: 1-acyl-sn-glycerol-3-phosphate acyltransferase [Flavisolibacter sp.]|nr:1-acyl-sn-glycerol-3-phosphate acyltransferase [Flavisolibacter sp.]